MVALRGRSWSITTDLSPTPWRLRSGRMLVVKGPFLHRTGRLLRLIAGLEPQSDFKTCWGRRPTSTLDDNERSRLFPQLTRRPALGPAAIDPRALIDAELLLGIDGCRGCGDGGQDCHSRVLARHLASWWSTPRPGPALFVLPCLVGETKQRQQDCWLDGLERIIDLGGSLIVCHTRGPLPKRLQQRRPRITHCHDTREAHSSVDSEAERSWDRDGSSHSRSSKSPVPR